jgi:hypothetical protein
MLEDSLKTLREYINKYLTKGYIRELKSLTGAPTLFVPKVNSTPR